MEYTGVLGAMALNPGDLLAMGAAPKHTMGYQLYSIRDKMATDPIATLKALKALGYQDFELYGFDEEKGKYYGFTAKEFKQILDDLDVTVSSGHYGFSPYLEKSQDEIKGFVDRCITGAKTLGSSYITWPWIAPQQRSLDAYKRMAPTLNLIGEQVRKSGLGFAYHNHGFEFEDHGGQNGFDIILKETDSSLVKLQLDLYWVMHSAGRTPAELINAQPDRYVMWHIKDMDPSTKDYTELGNGSIDYRALLPEINATGLEFHYIEQGGNYAMDSLSSAARSAQYFKEHLQRLL